jgi:hypothetical protein
VEGFICDKEKNVGSKYPRTKQKMKNRKELEKNNEGGSVDSENTPKEAEEISGS